MAIPTVNVDERIIKKGLQGELLASELSAIGSQFGRPDLPAGEGSRFIYGGNVYEPIRGGGDRYTMLRNLGSSSAFQSRLAAEEAEKKLAQQRSQREAFNQSQQSQEQAFLNKFSTEYPAALQAVEQELGLPQLRQEAFTSLQDLENLPEQIAQASMGKDINANQLSRMQSARRADRLPEVQDLLQNLQFSEEEFGRRSERALTPLMTEAKMLTDRIAREATGFNFDQEAALNTLLQKMQIGANLTIAEMNQATRLAELEQQKDQFERQMTLQEQQAGDTNNPRIGTTISLGDRTIVLDEFGNILNSFNEGLAPSRGSSGGGGDSLGLF